MKDNIKTAMVLLALTVLGVIMWIFATALYICLAPFQALNIVTKFIDKGIDEVDEAI